MALCDRMLSSTQDMKKWLYRIGSVLLILFAVLLLVAAWSETDTATMSSYKNNPDLPTIKPEWPGTPVDQKDRFMNHEYPFLRARSIS
jgi:hypothetical protein